MTTKTINSQNLNKNNNTRHSLGLDFIFSSGYKTSFFLNGHAGLLPRKLHVGQINASSLIHFGHQHTAALFLIHVIHELLREAEPEVRTKNKA